MRIPRAAAAALACAVALGAARCIPEPDSGHCEAPPGDVVDPCAGPSAGGGALPGTPDPGEVPAGSVGEDGGRVDRLWFAVTGDTRPGSCNRTEDYPSAAIGQIARAMKALRVQFALDLGDHMYVCNQSLLEAQAQMRLYLDAVAQGPPVWWMTMGNHDCGNEAPPYSCFAGRGDANFTAYMAALRRPLPYYATDVQTSLGKARIVVIADDSWDGAQADWLESTLAAADATARYTVVARHHPVTGPRTGNSRIVQAISRHKHSLILTAHSHLYARDAAAFGGRSVIVGLGGAPSTVPPGFATVLQDRDGSLTFVRRDANGNPIDVPWTVAPQ